jgi:putative aldouronate transport system substrate-binding protein
MVNKRILSTLLTVGLLTGVILSSCSYMEEPVNNSEKNHFTLTIAVNLVGEVPAKDNEVERRIEEYTGTDLQIQWVPGSAYDEKVNIMIASGELPMLMKVNYNPTIIAAIQSDVFWEIGPYLKDYPNLSAQEALFYDNISVNGRVYGVPLFRDLGRAAIHYRKDWFDAMGLTVPKSLESWYEAIRRIALEDPDRNGKNDTYGLIVDKNYNQGTFSMLTRLSVAMGGANKWDISNGSFVPEFMTSEFFETMKLFRRLYSEGLINPDFAVVDATEADKLFEAGKAGLRISGGNAQTILDKLVKLHPTAVVDAAPLEGRFGRRVPGESGNAGFLAIPTSKVKDEAELRQILTIIDKLMDEPIATLLAKGIEGKHYIDMGDYTEPDNREDASKVVKPYRDALPQRGEAYNVKKPSKQTELFLKNHKIVKENEAFAILNPALNLHSRTFLERGSELEMIITDAQTKFIMGKLDEEGWGAEVEKWRKNGGDLMAQEYKISYEHGNKK